MGDGADESAATGARGGRVSALAAEIDGIDLEDVRLNRRARRLLEQLGDQPMLSIPAACGGWNETRAAYRLFDHPQVTAQAVLAPPIACMLERMGAHQRVLCIQDTREFDATGKSSLQGLGPLNLEVRQGLYLHPTRAITPDRWCLGRLDGYLWTREPGSFGQDKDPNRPLEEKESVRWVDGYPRVNERAEHLPDTRLTYVADRKADLYDRFVEAPCPESAADGRVRGQHDRVPGDGTTLRRRLADAPVLAETTFERPASHGVKARRVHPQIQVVRVTLPAPYRPDRTLPEGEVTALLATEPQSPAGEEPVDGLLLTHRPVETPEQALETLQGSLCRWQIEVFFRILKSGCRIETRQLERRERLEPTIAFYMIIAWRVLFLSRLGRDGPEISPATSCSTQRSGRRCTSSLSARRPRKPHPRSIAWCAWSPASVGSSTVPVTASPILRPCGLDSSGRLTSCSPWTHSERSGREDMGIVRLKAAYGALTRPGNLGATYKVADQLPRFS